MKNYQEMNNEEIRELYHMLVKEMKKRKLTCTVEAK